MQIRGINEARVGIAVKSGDVSEVGIAKAKLAYLFIKKNQSDCSS